ncbi:PQQ-binding-like beta-propeller repeat protein [Jidongwangia harbinensis]|uniref:PQQ-binding-like beta-propeller repeat protein n=1 Tax=Jidongwangia harbinensis TaxID=2878561 RepID=UPI001CD9E1D0|nr:PQQ-binding-like beta-propeller repeat protein [Jidongwangia harbinensis]MCA2216107.1 PQQ-like beta-propeller repeat protein [Jidongwangia harbinensis]
MAVIDLDLHASRPPAPIRPRLHRYRELGLAVAAVLALVLGGAAASTPTVWRHLGSVPLNSGDAIYAPGSDRVYTAMVTGDQMVTTAWDTDPLRQVWSVAAPDRRTGSYLEPLPGGLLMQYSEPDTRILDAATGATRWSWPSQVQLIGPRVGVVTDAVFAPGTRYDNASGEPGQLYFAPNGQPHTRPPERTGLHGVDLATGRRLWSMQERGSVYAVPATGDTGTLTVVSAQGIQVRDGNTGALLRRRDLPRADPREIWFPEAIGDLLVVRRGAMITGYGLDTLQPRWTEPVDATDDRIICSGVPCRRTADAIAVLDRRTGQTAWRTDPDAFLHQVGNEVLESGTDTGRPVSIRDRTTGAVRTDLRAWDAAVTSGRDGLVLVSRFHEDESGTAFGIRQAGAKAVRPLGVSDLMLRNCQVSTALVACLGTGQLEVFAYRS